MMKNGTANNKLVIQVQYWGGWGYGRYYKSLRDFLYAQPDLASRIVVQERPDHGITGNFEVTTTTGNGDVIVLHSKRSGKAGRCNTDAERYDLVDKLQDILSEQLQE